MATQSMSYDHPLYTTRQSVGGSISGNGGTYRFAAWTAMLVKSITVKPTTAGTSADTMFMYKVTGTTTTTQTIGTYGSAATTSTSVIGTLTLAAGDALEVIKGTDATGAYGIGIELAVVPGSTDTV